MLCLYRGGKPADGRRELYLWASTIFVSRAFSAKVLAGVVPHAELPEENVSVLLPFIDVLNHRPLAKVEWRAGERDVLFVVLEHVAAGEEVANNYGPRNNEQRECLMVQSFPSQRADVHASDDELRFLSPEQPV